MSKTVQEGVFILLKVIKRHEEKRPEGRTESSKLKTIFEWFQKQNWQKLLFRLISGFNTPFCLDDNGSGGSIMLFVQEDTELRLIGPEKLPVECFYYRTESKKAKVVDKLDLKVH